MMSTCSKCQGHLFELSENSPAKSRYKLWFVQCSTCGVPIGAMEYLNAGTNLARIEERVKSLESELQNIRSVMNNLVAMLRKSG